MIQILYWVTRVLFWGAWAVSALRVSSGTRRANNLKSQLDAMGGTSMFGSGQSMLLDMTSPERASSFFQFAGLSQGLVKSQMSLNNRTRTRDFWAGTIGWLTSLKGRKCPYLAGVLDVAFLGWALGAVNGERVLELIQNARHVDWSTVAHFVMRTSAAG